MASLTRQLCWHVLSCEPLPDYQGLTVVTRLSLVASGCGSRWWLWPPAARDQAADPAGSLPVVPLVVDRLLPAFSTVCLRAIVLQHWHVLLATHWAALYTRAMRCSCRQNVGTVCSSSSVEHSCRQHLGQGGGGRRKGLQHECIHAAQQPLVPALPPPPCQAGILGALPGAGCSIQACSLVALLGAECRAVEWITGTTALQWLKLRLTHAVMWGAIT